MNTSPVNTSSDGYKFGTFSGVFLPSILTIFGVVMFLRLGNVTGEVGVAGALLIFLFAESIALATGLSISSISTNTAVGGGGPYFLISRALGPGFGAAIGLTYFFSQSLSVPFYLTGFADAVRGIYPGSAGWLDWLAPAALAVLFIIAVIGTDWAVRTQYFIAAILGISIGAIAFSAIKTGPQLQLLARNWTVEGVIYRPWVLAAPFAVFFPAVTGFLAGVNMSGDLADPRHSIPRGTLAAIGLGFLVYLGEILLLGAAWPAADLSLKSFELLRLGGGQWCGRLIFAGVVAATLSSALGTLVGAPRILQSFAGDRIFPALNFFASGSKRNNEPLAAMVVTLFISIGIIWWGTKAPGNQLNNVAQLVTMFTLCTYCIINLAAAMEHFAANPSFRPKFRAFHWSIGIYGALASLAAALFISPYGLLAAFVAVLVIFLLARRCGLVQTFGDARRGYYFECVRRNLIHLEALPPSPKNWRPQFLVLSGADKRHETLLFFADLLINNRGLLSVLRMVAAAPGRGGAARSEALRELRNTAARIDSFFVPDVVVTPEEQDFDQVLNIYLQSRSTGPLMPNIVLSGWPRRPERFGACCRRLRISALLGKSSLLLVNQKMTLPQKPAGTIDVWWRGQRNGSLMLTLAYLLTRNRDWNLPIRLLRAAEPGADEAGIKAELRHLAEEARIEVREEVFPNAGGFPAVFRRESKSACVIFLGFLLPQESEAALFAERYNSLLENMPLTFLVSAAEEIKLD